jgi:4-hydroxy-tetrahydrodipicolinate synthase
VTHKNEEDVVLIEPGAPIPEGSLHGIIPALVSPLDADGRVDEASVHTLIEFQIQSGVHALFVLGSTGEGPLLPREEKLRLVRATVAAASGRLPVLAGISHASPAESVALGREFQAAGANGLVTTAPYYYLHSQAELVRYFRYLHERLGLPLTTYDVPSAVKVKLSAATVRTLAAEGLIVGIKDSSGDLAGFREMTLGTAHVAGFRAFTGSEHYVDAALQVGGHGGVLGLASVTPGLYVQIYAACVRGDWQAAASLQRQAIGVLQMMHVAMSGGSLTAGAIGAFKVALRELGVIRSVTMSMPLQPLTDEEQARVLALVRDAGLERAFPHDTGSGLLR